MHRSALDTGSGPAADIAALWWVMFVISAVVFGVVVIVMLLAVVRRRRAGRPLGRVFLAVGGLAVPAVVLGVLAVLTIGTLPATSAPGDSADLTIDVTARQYFWDVRYPDGTVTANEIHIPVGRTVEVRLTSGDVIHSFWVPSLNRKMDAIPGETNRLLLEADRPGTYLGQCAEFCGLQHAHMGIRVIADPPKRFAAWLARESRPAAAPTSADALAGQQVFMGSACVYCHTIGGTNASGHVGPDLTHLASRGTIAAGTLRNTTGNLAGWILDPQRVKPGNRMPATDLSGPELQNLLAYLETLR